MCGFAICNPLPPSVLMSVERERRVQCWERDEVRRRSLFTDSPRTKLDSEFFPCQSGAALHSHSASARPFRPPGNGTVLYATAERPPRIAIRVTPGRPTGEAG